MISIVFGSNRSHSAWLTYLIGNAEALLMQEYPLLPTPYECDCNIEPCMPDLETTIMITITI